MCSTGEGMEGKRREGETWRALQGLWFVPSETDRPS